MINSLMEKPVRNAVTELLARQSAAQTAASSTRRWLALGIAVVADAVQIGLAPFFAEGALSPFNFGLDLVVAIALTRLLGWHMAFVPSFLIEQVPFLDLAPTWTVAALIAMRKRDAKSFAQG